MRKPLAENILLVGGTAMTPGLKSRLREELIDQLNSDRYKDKLFLKTFKFHSAPAKENYTAWLGGKFSKIFIYIFWILIEFLGAMYGYTDIVQMKGLTKENYLKDRRVPDWSNLLDNKKEEVITYNIF